MNKQDKINALRKVLEGEPIDRVFPSLEVFIVEGYTEKHSLVMVNEKYGNVPNDQVDTIISKVKEQHPFKSLKVLRISKQEYDEISETLEKEY
ncbi:hypothetical protein EFA69_09555 [Rufibacter immobilis]|uniref:Uncharacterized protein n=1 Tax=Rufibacter immobilis TaxID=1348778 RepID=A0A3M9MW57_9BACT|nr:hypothetical protein [Rufibacter immobilis]RNI29774.1 hypothetical protein EFA69_09555 [Rufibacter immobilis]